jgi:hypothetical protein
MQRMKITMALLNLGGGEIILLLALACIAIMVRLLIDCIINEPTIPLKIIWSLVLFGGIFLLGGVFTSYGYYHFRRLPRTRAAKERQLLIGICFGVRPPVLDAARVSAG